METIDEIKQELLELGFNVNSRGIMYWIEAIKYAKENPTEWETFFLYDYIAKRYGSTERRVERAMRVAIAPAIENIQKKYNYHGKIKTSTFLSLIRFKLI